MSAENDTTKVCKGCNEKKALVDFYVQKRSGGRLPLIFGKCKDCVKEAVRANRASKIDYYREYDRARANEPKRVEARAAYARTPEGMARYAEGQARWNERNKEKLKANYTLTNAVRDGRVCKPSACERCGTTGVRIHGHHDDYSKPLDVRWLCDKCHKYVHREINELRRQNERGQIA
jgi:ribosomal protein S27AE